MSSNRSKREFEKWATIDLGWRDEFGSFVAAYKEDKF